MISSKDHFLLPGLPIAVAIWYLLDKGIRILLVLTEVFSFECSNFYSCFVLWFSPKPTLKPCVEGWDAGLWLENTISLQAKKLDKIKQWVHTLLIVLLNVKCRFRFG